MFEMTCQALGVLCLRWTIVMASIVRTLPVDNRPRLIPPEIIEGPNIHEIFNVNSDGDGVVLRCNATGTPPIMYEWLYNGLVLQSEYPREAGNGHLPINTWTKDVEGYYQCRASNEAGVAISDITFLEAAVFDYSLARQITYPLSVRAFDHVVLSCNHVIRSVPPATVTWAVSPDGNITTFQNVILGEQVTQAQNGSLVFSYVRKNNSGIYKCDMQNPSLRLSKGGNRVNLTIEMDEDSVEAKLTEAPVLLYSSPNVTVLEGQELSLQCLFGSWQDHTVEWRTPSGWMNVGHSLIVRSVTAADAGVYSCRARKMSSRNMPLSSPTVNISVQVDAIPSFSTRLSNQEVPVSGRDATFRCQGRGRPSPEVTWYINGTSVDKLEDAVDHSISGDGPTSVLVLRSTRTSATVTCNISNAHGYRLQSAVVTVGVSIDIPSTSSQYVIITSLMTSSDKPPSTKQHSMTTKPYYPYKSSTTPHHSSVSDKQTEKGKINTNDPPARRVVENSPPSSMITIIVIAAVAVVVIAVVAVIVVVCIIKRRHHSGRLSITEQVEPLRIERRYPNEHIYDSDDSGFDDVKAEYERRALQGNRPSS